MKKIWFLVICILFIQNLSALNISIEKKSSGEVMIPELNEPAEFQLSITNYDSEQMLNFYNLVGLKMEPSEKILFKSGEVKIIDFVVSPIGDFKNRGNFIFNYYIKGSESEYDLKKSLTFVILDLEDVFEIGSGDINSEEQSVEIYVKNKVNKEFKNVNAVLSSVFFNLEKNFDIEKYGTNSFIVYLNREDFRKLMAGFYTFSANISVENVNAYFEGVVKFPEVDFLEVTKREYGFLIHNTIIRKENKGNTVYVAEEFIQKNIFSRLTTSFSPEPNLVERDGFKINYFWRKSIAPGEILEINVTTNWILPLVVFLLLILVVVLVKLYSKKEVELRKKISFVRAKGGEFALKVSVYVYARKHADRINIIDRLPPLVKLYGKFGGDKPSRFNEKSRVLEWNFDSMEKGESRILSYVVYSKVGVLGKFVLPSATAVYEDNGKVKESSSNRAFFVAEPLSRKSED